MPENFPTFPYHPHPVATGAIREGTENCSVCGLSRGFAYDLGIFSDHPGAEDAIICPWCIADGSAARKFDRAEYRDGTMESFTESYEHSGLDSLDTRFYDMGISFDTYQQTYIRENPDLFLLSRARE